MITTAGKILLEEGLPKDLHTDEVIDKGGLSKMLKKIGEKHAPDYGKLVNHIKDVGNHVAYATGTSFSLKDFKPLTDIRDAAFKTHQKELDAIQREALANPAIQNHPDFLKRKTMLHAKIEESINDGVKRAIKENPNNLTMWVTSGARGDASMARQMVAMAGLNVDVTNRLSTEMAKRSFSEGLSPIDFHVHALGARRGVVNTYISVRDPGAFAKELNAISSDMLITQADCGTHNGRMLPSQSSDVLDRCLSEDVPGVGHRNDVVTGLMQEAMNAKHVGMVKVRSPLTCEAHEGVCARCYGINESGQLPHLGEHVGIKAAQAITEPLTQLALNNKHSGGVVGAGKSPLQQILQFMHAPKVFAGGAILARKAGVVTKVEAAPAGGFNVHVDGLKHYVGPDFGVLVKPGDRLEKGDALSTGQANPVEIVEHKGMERGREYFADSVKGMYADSGIKGHGKIFETMSRAILNLGQVVHPGEHEFEPGEIVHWNSVQPLIQGAKTEKIGLTNAAGRILASDHGLMSKYQVITPKSIGDLRAKGIQQVHVYAPNQLVVKPIMLGTERAALHKGDWMANLGFRFIGQSFKENAATGASANIHGWNPIPAYAYGAEFGKGHGGRF